MISFTDQIFEDQQRKSIEFCAGVDPGFFCVGGGHLKNLEKIGRKLTKS